jgi:hypothetical protein
MARLLGEAYIAILPDTTQFGPATRAAVDKDVAAIRPEVNIGAQLNAAQVAKLTAQLKAIGKGTSVDVGAQLSAAQAAKVAAQLKAIGKGTSVDVGVTLDQAAAAKMQAQLEAYMKDHTATVGVQLSDAELAKVALTLDEFLKGHNANVGVQIPPTQLAKMQATLDAWARGITTADVPLTIDPASLAKMKTEFAAFADSLKANVDLNIIPAMNSLDGLILQAKYLQHQFDDMNVDGDDAQMEAKLASLSFQAAAIAKALRDVPIDFDAGPAIAKLGELTVMINLMRDELDKLGDVGTAGSGLSAFALGLEGVATKALIAKGAVGGLDSFISGAGGGWGALTSKVTLFAGVLDNVLPSAITRVSGLHILLDWVAEFAAVLVPAAIDFAAWGSVMGFVLADAKTRFQATSEAASALGVRVGAFGQATGATIGPLQKMQNELNPTVWEIFGDAVNVAKAKTGTFNNVIQGVNTVVEDLAARMTDAFKSASFGTILQNGITDFQRLGTIIGNLGGAFGAFVKDVPGYAAVIEELWVKLSYGIENFVNFAGPVIKAGLALHGFFLYVGLATTAGVAMLAWLGNATARFFTFASSAVNLAGGFDKIGGAIAAISAGEDVETATAGMGKLATSFASAGAAVKGFGVQLLAVATNPAVLAIAAIGAAVFEMTVHWDAADQAVDNFVTNIETKIDGLTGGQALQALPAAFGQLNTELQKVSSPQAYQQLAQNWDNIGNLGRANALNVKVFWQSLNPPGASTQGIVGRLGDVVHVFTSLFGVLGGPASQNSGAAIFDAMQNNINKVESAFNSLGGQEKNLLTVTGELMNGTSGATKSTFTWAQSLGILDAANVQAGDSLQVMQTKVQGLLAGWQDLGFTGGQTGNAVNALTFDVQLQQSSVGKLTTAYSDFIGMITGGESAFATFGEGMSTLDQALSSAGAKGVTFNDSLDKLSVKGTSAGASLTGLSQASLNARGAFEQQVTSAQNVYNSLLPLAAASNQGATGQHMLAQAMKDMVATMLPLAKNNPALLSQLSDLAQIAGGPTTTSFKTLSAWVGNTKNPMSNLNGIVSTLTISAGNLAKDAQNLAGAFGVTLTQAISNAIFAAQKGPEALNGLATALENLHTGKGSATAVEAALKQFAPALITMTGNSKLAENQFIVMANALGISTAAAEKMWTAATGTGSALAKQAAQAKALNDTLNTLQGTGLKLTYTQADNLWNVLKQNTLATVNGHAATAEQTFIALASKGFGLTTTQAQEMWNNMKPTLLDVLTSKASISKQAFEDLANKGFGISKAAAGQMWTEMRDQYLDTLADKAGTTKAAFIDLAMKGLGITQAAASNLWTTLRKQYLDDLAQKAGTTKASFVNLAEQGLGISQQAATNLWDTLRRQYLDTLANKAGTTKSSFINLAEQGLNLSSSAATNLWDTMRKQYLDTLVQKGDTAKGAFINLAEQGLDLSNKAAGDLWDTMEHQYLDTLSRKAGETESQFIATAKQFGYTQTAAANLWNQLKTLAEGKYNVAVQEVLSGSGSISAKISATAIVLGGGGGVITPKATNPKTNPQIGLQSDIHAAGGAWINGNHSNTDTVPIMAKPGELIVPTQHAASVANHMASGGYKVPGYDSGGFVGQAAAAGSGAVKATQGVETDVEDFAKLASNAWSQAVQGAFQTAQSAAMEGGAYGGPSSFGGGFESLSALVSFAKYFMANGLNAAAAAGMAATISGEEDSAGPESRNCVPLYYKVVTTRGVLAHDEVLIGDQTPAYNVETGETELATILDVPYHYDAEMCQIGNAGWIVECTVDHKWITKNRGLVRADRLRMGETVLLGDGREEQVFDFERIDNQDSFCLTTTTGTWTVETDFGDQVWTGNSSGWGLIGWTGNTVGLPPGYTGPTGNVAYDLQEQLKGVIGYMNAKGGPGPLNAAGNPVAAGQVWSRYEGPASPLSDTRSAIANEIYAELVGTAQAGAKAAVSTASALAASIPKISLGSLAKGGWIAPQTAGGAGWRSGAGVKPHSAGGMISEPVVGFGTQSGIPYSFAENGPEMVSPANGADTNNFMQPMTQSQGQQLLNALNQLVQQGQQLPANLAAVQKNGLTTGMRRGVFNTGG